MNIIRTLLDHFTETISVYTKSGYKTSEEDKKLEKMPAQKDSPKKKKKNLECCNMFLVTNCIWDFIQQWNIYFVVYFVDVFFFAYVYL